MTTTNSPTRLRSTHPSGSANSAAWSLLSVAGVWFALVVIGAETGFCASHYQPVIGTIVATIIVLPSVWYLRSPRARRVFEAT